MLNTLADPMTKYVQMFENSFFLERELHINIHRINTKCTCEMPEYKKTFLEAKKCHQISFVLIKFTFLQFKIILHLASEQLTIHQNSQNM